MSTLFKCLQLSQSFDADGIHGVDINVCSTFHTRATHWLSSTLYSDQQVVYMKLIVSNTENFYSVCRLGSSATNAFCCSIKWHISSPNVGQYWMYKHYLVVCEMFKHFHRHRLSVWCRWFGFVICSQVIFEDFILYGAIRNTVTSYPSYLTYLLAVWDKVLL